MAINVTSFGNTPQAGDDLFLSGATGLTEDSTNIVWLKVMLNDSGGAAKTLYSLDDGLSGGTTLRPTDLLVQDTARTEALSTDTSRGGARIWITSDGQVGYDAGTLSGAFTQQLQALNAGEYLYDSFTYAIRLGNGTLSWATATLQFAGANDAPVVTGAVLGNAVEDGAALTLDALANASDVDAGAVLSVVDVPATLPPGVSYDAATHSFSIDPGHAAYQHLGAGVVLPVSVVYGVSDGTATTPAAVTFTITGANDAAVIGDPADSEVTEDVDVSAGALQASGVLAISDVDTGEAAFQTTVAGVAGNLGSLGLAVDGSYMYSVANADAQFLGAGDTHVDSFTVTSLDGTSKEVSFTVHGVNDAAVIGDPTNASVTEDADVVVGDLTATGTISISDVDQGEASFQAGAVAAAGALGSLALATDGSYTYSVANADVQFLGATDSQVDTFTISALDGTTKDVSFTIQGVNDAAVIGDPTDALVTEDAGVVGGNLSATGSILISDVDQGQASFQTGVVAAAGALGSLALASDGSYTYNVVNADVQFLGATDTQVDTFIVTALDGTTKDVSFTVQGENDAAVIGDPTDASVTEDADVVAGNLSATGSTSISDVDQGQASFQTSVVAAAGALGSLVLASDGSYAYSVANADVQFLGATDAHVDTFTITALDGTTKDVSFTIQGANDVALISGVASASVQEDTGAVGGQLLAGGLLSVSDLDAGQSGFLAQAATAGSYGTFTLAADGTWAYSVSNSLAAVQGLNTGQSLTDSFTAQSLDSSASQVVTVTIQGLDDTTGTTGNDTYSFAATGSGVHAINDPGGNSDRIQITDSNVALSTLNFERAGNDLQVQVNGQSITIQNHFAGNAIEEISFASGQAHAGYSLTGTFNIFSGAGFVAGNGSSADVVAGTSGGETLDGGAGASGRDLLFGNGSDDILIGRNSGDLLVAGAGNDSLQGGDGNDVLVGGAGSDTFLFNTGLSAASNVDRIADFEAGAADFVMLSKATFAGLSTSGSAGGTALQGGEFLAVANAGAASVGGGIHVLYDASTGNLYYDSNGGSSAGRTLFATLDPAGLTGAVDASDFKVGL